MSFIVKYVSEKDDVKRFLSLPSKLYDKDKCPQNYNTEKKILKRKHVLSVADKFDNNESIFENLALTDGCFYPFPYIVIDSENKQTVARCILTYYEKTDIAYIGFFEAYNNFYAVKALFDAVIQKAKNDGIKQIIGPINCSIFLGYRFKVDRFDKTYTGEPYNKNYYPELWERYGFAIKDNYSSNQLRVVKPDDLNEKFKRLYDRYVKRGYIFADIKKKDFDFHIKNIYRSIMSLYANFSGFQYITEEQFVKLFSYLKYIINPTMAKVVYYDEELMAFCISLPNYGSNVMGKITLKKLKNILKIKKEPKEYIILYLGANSNSPGLGCALIHAIRNELVLSGCTSIGALIKEGNLTERLYSDLYIDKFKYKLYEYNVENVGEGL